MALLVQFSIDIIQNQGRSVQNCAASGFGTQMDLLKKERTALVVCDMQLDTLGSLSASGKEALLSSIKIALEAARKHNWSVIYSGLKFESRYEGVSPNHKLYGALKKLNQKLNDDKVHFFMSGWKRSEIVSELAPTANDKIVWR